MKKFLIAVGMILSLTLATGLAEMEFFGFDFPDDGDTQADWNMATAIVQNIERPKIPTDYSVNVVKEYGAVGDGAADDKPAIQKAIDETSEKGGGQVVVPAGTYFCKGSIELKSCVDLHLEEGATLLFSPVAADFLPVVKTRWEGTELLNYSPMVYAYGQHDIAITGKGKIDGNQDSEFLAMMKNEGARADVATLRRMGADGVPLEERVFGEGHYLRPSCIQINYCDRVLLEDYTVTNSPFWINHVNCSNHVQVRGLTVDSMFGNNDGVDIESSTFVVVEENNFHTGDDSVVVKAGRDYDGRQVGLPSKYIVVRNNIMGGEDGIALGSEMAGGISYVFFENNTLPEGVSVIRFKSNLDRGGTVEHIRVRNMDIGNFKTFIWFQMKYPGDQGGNFPAIYNDIVFEDFTVDSISETLFKCEAPAGYPLQNVLIKDVTVTESATTTLQMENLKNLVLDDFVVNDQRMNGVISSY